MEQERSYC